MLHGGVADTLSTLLQVVDFFSSEHVIEMVYYKEVMHYADHTYEWLNQWSLPGIWVGCLFSLGWLRLMRWNVYRLIALALFVFALYAGGFYFFIDASISIDLLRISIICRGFSYAVLCIAFMWCLHAIMSFEHFFKRFRFSMCYTCYWADSLVQRSTLLA